MPPYALQRSPTSLCKQARLCITLLAFYIDIQYIGSISKYCHSSRSTTCVTLARAAISFVVSLVEFWYLTFLSRGLRALKNSFVIPGSKIRSRIRHADRAMIFGSHSLMDKTIFESSQTSRYKCGLGSILFPGGSNCQFQLPSRLIETILTEWIL
jgi:hypothetical protein